MDYSTRLNRRNKKADQVGTFGEEVRAAFANESMEITSLWVHSDESRARDDSTEYHFVRGDKPTLVSSDLKLQGQYVCSQSPFRAAAIARM